MPSDDVILNLRQIASYPPVPSAGGLLIIAQQSGLGGPYVTIDPADFVATAIPMAGDISITGSLTVGFNVSAASLNVSDAEITSLYADDGDFAALAVNAAPVATEAYVDRADAVLSGAIGVLNDALNVLGQTSVRTWNGRVGDVTMGLSDLLLAGGAPIVNPNFQGSPTAPTPTLKSNSDRIATTQFVNSVIIQYFDDFIRTYPIVNTFNGRSGNVTLTLDDVVGADGALLDSPAFFGTPTAPTPPPNDNSTRIATTEYVDNAIASNTTWAPLNSPEFVGYPTAPTANPGTATAQLATTAFVMAAVAASVAGVSTFMGRTGDVTLEASDITNAGGALLQSPIFVGTPQAPTVAPGDNSNAIATTAWVLNELGGATIGVMSFNGRGGAVTLNTTDITDAGGAPLVSPALSGAPTAPTAPTGTSTDQLATTAFVQAAIAAISTGVVSFNGRDGAITLTQNDVSAAGGAIVNSPNFTGVPTAPTAVPGTNTTQIATTAFVAAAIQAAGGVTSFNSRAGAITLLASDLTAAGGALLASPNFSGAPTAPTAAGGTSSTQIATTAFVTSAMGAYVPLTGGTMTGDLVMGGQSAIGIGLTVPANASSITRLVANGSITQAGNGQSYMFNTYYTGAAYSTITAGASQLIQGSSDGTINFYSNAGLAAGASFTPTSRATISPNGVITATGGLVAPNAAISSYITIPVGNAIGIRYNSANAIGFLWASPSLNAYVDGTFYGTLVGSQNMGGVYGTPIYRMAMGSDGTLAVWATNGYSGIWSANISSDRRLKTNIHAPTKDALAALDALNVYECDLQPPMPGSQKQHWDWSLMADELENVIPLSVIPPFGENGVATIRELPIIAALVAAVKQLLFRIEQLEAA